MGDKDEDEVQLSEDDEVEDPSSPRKQSLLLRTKKFLSTKTAGNKLGKKAILQAIGEEGEGLFKAFTGSISLFYGATQGKKFTSDLLAIVLKVKILIDEEILKLEMLKDTEELTHSFVFDVQQNFDRACSDVKHDPIDPKQACATLVKLKEAWTGIFSKMMQEKNVNKLKCVVDMVSNLEFMKAVLNKPEYSSFRVDINNFLKQLLESVQVDSKIERACRYANCPNLALKSKGLFRSIGYCKVHHLDNFKPIFETPILHHFLFEGEQSSLYFLDFLKSLQEEEKEENPLVVFSFLSNLEQWRSISNKEMKFKRAQIMADKFLAQGSSSCLFCVPIEVRESLLKDLSGKDPKTARLGYEYFDSIRTACLKVMEGYFERFRKSKVWDRFVVSFQIPTGY